MEFVMSREKYRYFSKSVIFIFIYLKTAVL